MNTHFNPNSIESIKGKYVIIDTNVLSDSSSNTEFYTTLYTIFKDTHLLIDPIVKLEFLRGAYVEKTYREKSQFLKIEIFNLMVDHQEIYQKVYDSAFNIARIYSHNKKPNIPLGDILITARQEVQKSNDYYFLTEDKEDFTGLLFDRISLLTFERINKDGQDYLQHFQLIKFNHQKFEKCLQNLPQ